MKARVAAIQMVSAPEVETNLAAAGRLIAQAASEGAQLVALPEYFCILGRHETDKVKVREKDASTPGGGGPIQSFLSEAAARNKVWLVGGTIPVECDDPARVRSACLVFDAGGRRVARYDKIHLFGFDNGTERYEENRSISAGSQPVAFDSPFGKIGLSICYDLRFPELYRSLAPVDLIFVPAAFTAVTGEAHWEPLLRARAIESLAHVIAPAQGGLHANGRKTHGHSMVIDPWGRILAERPAGEGIVMAEVDPAVTARCREMLPALQHRVL